MASPIGERAIADALAHGGAFIKVISANDAGATTGHQYGFLLQNGPWKYFSPFPPTKGRNDPHPVTVTWPNGRVTKSTVHWYGLTKYEYRLTRFGRDFPYRTPDDVGSLLVLIRITPEEPSEFVAYVLDFEEDFDDIQASLGVDIGPGWALYLRPVEGVEPPEAPDDCVDRRFREIAATTEKFPTGDVMTAHAWAVLRECDDAFSDDTADSKIYRSTVAEYALFRMMERKIYAPDINRLFASVDDFMKTAAPIHQRRMSRAGRGLENHVGMILKERGIPYDARAAIQGVPDIVIPGMSAYEDENYPHSKLFVVPVKRTCKDRWRQVLEEGPKVKRRYLFTEQKGISGGQMALMHKAGLTLVVPEEFHEKYPKERDLEILTVEEFLALVEKRLGMSNA